MAKAKSKPAKKKNPVQPKTYRGGCHCGAVQFEVEMKPPKSAVACNCSICSRAGYLLAFPDESAFRLVAGENALGDYQFGKKTIHHYFCRTCGVRSFSRGDDGIAINLRCIQDVNISKLKVEYFDGASL